MFLLVSCDKQNYSQQLLKAVACSNYNLAKKYLELGADPDIMSNEGFTPLMLCAMRGDTETIRLLINSGADIKKLGTNDSCNALSLSITYKHAPATELLIKAGSDVNWRYKQNGASLLIFAAAYGMFDIVKNLISSGALVNVVDSSGESALFKAVKTDDSAFIAYLLEKGADANHLNKNGQTALHIAAAEGKENVVKAMIHAGVQLDPLSTSDRTPLNYALGHKHTAIAKYLLSQGANVQIRDNRGIPILAYACEINDYSIVSSVLSKLRSIDPNYKVEKKLMTYCEKKKYLESVRALKEFQ